MEHSSNPAGLDLAPDASSLSLSGAWTTQGLERFEERLAALAIPSNHRLVIDASALTALDTAGALVLLEMVSQLSRSHADVQLEGLSGHRRELFDLVVSHLPQTEEGPPRQRMGVLENVGRATWAQVEQSYALLAFIGEVTWTLMRNALHPVRVRWRLFAANIEMAGVNALPIIGLLSFLIGIVIAYQGGVQLRTYGANIFIVDLVTVTMLREIGPMMAAVIVAGRSGSAYAAQIATMQVTEEVDALRTVGAGPFELLVLPKLLGLIVALPLLTVFSDLAGVFGGMVMAAFVLDVEMPAFVQRIPDAVSLTTVMVGIGKTPVFAAIIALVGCFQGFRARGGADSVGEQTTVSVVQSIFWVIVADAVFSILFSWFGI
ncbi:MAG: MlaE family lipid ABC transporter permease subunit [Gammaproteobacteria bacterium]|nr:MlaE family lipid ABC transporter permease subunit [Gammaproteobacteria bacterium]NIR84944.1 MlaE family lipid ABC transporter permease subunit [Gammaproteobacteria bacterium]NIR91793.1 MlaE family lipid ABC transporter permease subunit [Gammaproteobacteria bacterium]NIU05991.1 MlaE family lipid ABC transporter permease subunit [Gammaproteobacteria bacterium]NIV53038.1 MlaE family lipid ABC transporter permease subunit [Gammaproteobacteria bacterium]